MNLSPSFLGSVPIGKPHDGQYWLSLPSALLQWGQLLFSVGALPGAVFGLMSGVDWILLMSFFGLASAHPWGSSRVLLKEPLAPGLKCL